MKADMIPVTAMSLTMMLASCATPEKAAQKAEDQLIAQCQAGGGTYEPVSKSGTQKSRGFIVPLPFLLIGSTGSAEGYASGYCTGPNPDYETACFEQGEYPAPFPATSGCAATNDATHRNLLDYMRAAHAKCDPLGQSVGTVTKSGGTIEAVCVP